MITPVAIALTWAVSVFLAALALYGSRVPDEGHPQDDPQPTEPFADRCPDAFVVLNDGRFAEVWQ